MKNSQIPSQPSDVTCHDYLIKVAIIFTMPIYRIPLPSINTWKNTSSFNEINWLLYSSANSLQIKQTPNQTTKFNSITISHLCQHKSYLHKQQWVNRMQWTTFYWYQVISMLYQEEDRDENDHDYSFLIVLQN